MTVNEKNVCAASGASEESDQEAAEVGAEQGEDEKNNYTTEDGGTNGQPGGPGPAARERVAAKVVGGRQDGQGRVAGR